MVSNDNYKTFFVLLTTIQNKHSTKIIIIEAFQYAENIIMNKNNSTKYLL